MKIFGMSLFVILGTQLSYAQAPSVSERDMRERLGVIEEKLTGLDGKVTEGFASLERKISEMNELNSSKAPTSQWVCEGYCYFEYWQDRGTHQVLEYVNGKGSDSILALNDLSNSCKALVAAQKGYSSKLYADVKRESLAMIKNSCVKN